MAVNVQSDVTTEFYEEQVRRLVDYHREHHEKDDLLLAIWYDRGNKRGDIRLLEVFRNFPDPGCGRLETFDFASTTSFPVKGKLSLTITSPDELRDAAARSDAILEKVRKDRTHRKVWADNEGETLYRDLVARSA